MSVVEMSPVTLVAMIVAALSGWALIHHSRVMLHNGITAAEGGGWTALILVEFMVHGIAVSCVLYL
jgi:hypothetical protein